MVDDPPIPEGSMINGQILITSYIDERGRMRYAVGTNGEMNIAQVLGLFVLSAMKTYEIYHVKSEPEQYPEDFNDEEDDDDE